MLRISVLAFYSLPFVIYADSETNTSNIVATQWESCSGGVNFAMLLTPITDKNGSHKALTLYINNTSNSGKAIILGPGASRGDEGFLIFITDAVGSRHLLHDHDPFHGNGSPQQEIDANTGSARLNQIPAGQTVTQIIKLTPDDLAKVKSNPILCSFSLVDLVTHQRYNIKSSPRQLIESIITSPNK